MRTVLAVLVLTLALVAPVAAEEPIRLVMQPTLHPCYGHIALSAVAVPPDVVIYGSERGCAGAAHLISGRAESLGANVWRLRLAITRYRYQSQLFTLSWLPLHLQLTPIEITIHGETLAGTWSDGDGNTGYVVPDTAP